MAPTYICVRVYTVHTKLPIHATIIPVTIIKTHSSESRGQAVRDERVSYLQVAPL